MQCFANSNAASFSFYFQFFIIVLIIFIAEVAGAIVVLVFKPLVSTLTLKSAIIGV